MWDGSTVAVLTDLRLDNFPDLWTNKGGVENSATLSASRFTDSNQRAGRSAALPSGTYVLGWHAPADEAGVSPGPARTRNPPRKVRYRARRANEESGHTAGRPTSLERCSTSPAVMAIPTWAPYGSRVELNSTRSSGSMDSGTTRISAGDAQSSLDRNIGAYKPNSASTA